MIERNNLVSLNRDEKSDFSILFKKNKVYIYKKNFSLNDFLFINEIECEVKDVSFPYDLSGGTSGLKNNRMQLSKLEGYFKEGNIKEIFENHPQKDKFLNLELSFNKQISLKGIYRPNNFEVIPFLLELGIYLNNNKLYFLVLSDFIGGKLPVPKYKFIKDVFRIPNIENEGINLFSVKIFPDIFYNIFPINGYKIPYYKNTVFSKLKIEDGIVKFVLTEEVKEDISLVPSIKKTLAYLEIYKENEDIFFKILNSDLKQKDLEEITDIGRIGRDKVKQKLFIEFVNNEFSSQDALKIISQKEPDDDILFDIAVKFENFGSYYRFKEVMNELLGRLVRNNDTEALEVVYLYLIYAYRRMNSSKSIKYFEKLWNLNRKYLIVWKDFFDDLIEYKNYYLAVEIGEYLIGKTDKDEYYLEKIGDIFAKNLKNNDKALEYYTKVLRISPDLIFVKLKVLDIYAKQNKNLFVIDRLNRLSEENKENAFLKVEIDKRLADLWFKEKHFERSIFHIERALEEYKNPSLYYKAYLASRNLKDDLRAFEYLKLALNEYIKKSKEKDKLYFKILSDISLIHIHRGEYDKAYDYLIEIPREYLTLKILDKINFLLKLLNKSEEIFKYFEIKEKFLKDKSDRIKFWLDNLKFFKERNDNKNTIDSLIKLALLDISNNDYFDEIEKILAEFTTKDEKFYEKIIRLYIKKALTEKDKARKSKLYYKSYEYSLMIKNKNWAYKILKKALSELPDDEKFGNIYKKWTDEKKYY